MTRKSDILPGVLTVLGLCLAPGPPVEGRESGAKEGSAFFERHIRPVLVEHCYDCHSEEAGEQKGGLLLDRAAGWLDGGDMGKAVVPGNVKASLLMTAVRRLDEDLEMPPKYALDDKTVSLLEQWIGRGAPGPADDMGETAFSELGDQDLFFERAKAHWAFQSVVKPDPPRVSNAEWSAHPVDRFLFAGLEEAGIAPSPAADPRTLIRRLYYDLTGLPPEAEEVERWSARFRASVEEGSPSLPGPGSPGKNSPQQPALSELVNELMGSPRFGEHFARMWLDVARYADTANSYRPDTKTPHYYPYAFTYRDYVIEAFNADKPIDRFILEQLAADLMGFAEDAPELAALGFLGVSPHRNKSDDFIDDVIDVTSRGLLGMTAACARCHDHKYEPIPTADYYSLYGVFASVTRPEPWKTDDYPLITGYPPEPRQRAAYEEARAGIDEKIAAAGNKKRGGNNRSVAQEIRETDLAQLLITHDGAPVRAMSVSEAPKPVTPVIYLRGDRSTRGDTVPRRFFRVLDPEQAPFAAEDSGRLDLAERIADPENPLTARVFVNRVWGALMGGFLVDTPSDFGLQGAAPAHPALLDWLAADFMEHDWSLKHLVRTIVTSRTYRQRSVVRPELEEIDPSNQLYARANAKRLSIEELRDSLLAVSGELDTRMRGRSGELWDGDYTRRRSAYGYINRFNLDPTLRSFDFPSPVQTQEKRPESVVPPQALFTMNAPFVIDQSEALVKRLSFDDGVDREARIDAIFEAILQRPADELERDRVGRFVDSQKESGAAAWPLVAQSVFMSNEFLYVD